ncbi:hypothetical protein C1H46_036628 [Malus baccata]|uniref:Uncharacterized protein n=1 Tax=Malus baccata TaxID=106549 RepID=A0A540KUN8_MALBA|nr:hypothetical protein C1H46_036628 [Malus baccata]
MADVLGFWLQRQCADGVDASVVVMGFCCRGGSVGSRRKRSTGSSNSDGGAADAGNKRVALDS